MSDAPRLLVIDDNYGWAGEERNRNREAFCQRLGLQDVTGDVRARPLDKPVAEAVFFQGQRETDGRIENDLEGTVRRIREAWQREPRPALLLLDLHFKTGRIGPDGRPRGSDDDRDPHQYFGLRVLERLWEDAELREIPVVILSSMDRDAIEERFAEHGVFDFFDKSDLDRQALRQLIDTYGLIEDDREDGAIVGRSLPLLKALREARRRAKVEGGNVLLLGESGTGKELLARYLHAKSLRHEEEERPLVTFFPQRIADGLIESELFGHVKGAFTGATKAKSGAAEKADGGTLFIDEFGDLPGSVQGKLLRLLDTNIRETQRQGGEETKQVALQVVMATNKLGIRANEGFRSDLLARAKARNPITLPPLRKREEDIPLLAEHFVRTYEHEYNAEQREITEDAMAALRDYLWPGNVRELEGVIEEAVLQYRGLRRLSEAHLGLEDQAAQGSPIPDENGAAPSTTARPPVTPTDQPRLAELIRQLNDDSLFKSVNPDDLRGALPVLQEACARLLDAGLRETKDPLSGKVFYTRAFKLITDEPDEEDTEIKRIIRSRLFRAYPSTIETLLPELPALRKLYEEKPHMVPNDVDFEAGE